jgi:hypothetical protein
LPKYTKCFKAFSRIINLQSLDDTIIFSTTQSGIRTVDKQSCATLTNILPQYLDKTTTATPFSPNEKLVAFANVNSVKVMVLSTQKILTTINLKDESIDIIDFDPTSKYIIIGTNKGRILQYRYNSRLQLSRLCSFPYHFPDEKILKIKDNYVSALTFYEDKMACSGYGGTIYIINLHSRENKLDITRSRVKIEALCFIDNDTLVSGNVDGVIEVISLKSPSDIKRMNAPFTKIKHIVVMPNKDYILISSDKNFISLINIKTLKIVDNKYIEFEQNIDKLIKKDDESLLVVLRDSTVLNVELLNINTLKTLIKTNRLVQAYKLLAKAPMLRGSKEQKKLQEKYEQKLKEAIKYLIKDDKESAQDITKPLMQLASKKDEIKLIYEAFKHYDKFKILFHEKKYPLAYSMCNKYPALKETIEYKSMEKFWQNSFVNAQKQMLLNNTESARVLLNDYLLVSSKRAIIKFILYKNKEFISFLKAIEKKEFKKITNIVKENHTFTNIDYYKALKGEMQENLNEAKSLIKIGNISLAKIIIERLEKDPKYEDIAYSLYQECDDIKKLFDAFNDDNLLLCYTILDAKPSLRTTDLAIHLEELWKQTMDECEKLAIMGKLQELEERLSELKAIASRADKIGDIYRIAYQTKITHLIKTKKYKSAKKYITIYTDLFGLDEEIKNIIKLYVKESSLKITLTSSQAKRKPRDFWLYHQS